MRFWIIFAILFSLLASEAFSARTKKWVCEGVRLDLGRLSSVADPTQFDSEEFPKWLYSDDKARAVVLLAHGLNLKPSKMESLGTLFRQRGFDVFRVALRGHRGNLGEMKDVDSKSWLNEAYSQYCIAYQRSKQLEVPLYFVGFSLGALVFEHLINQEFAQKVVFHKAVLLAPAIELRTRSVFLKPLFWLGKNLVLPSFSPKDYRANSGTPLAAYRALFDLRKDLFKRGLRKSNIPTLVFIDPKDELVSYKKTKELMAAQNLSRWKLISISNERSVMEGKRHHLIITKAALGLKPWREMTGRILFFLKSQ